MGRRLKFLIRLIWIAAAAFATAATQAAPSPERAANAVPAATSKAEAEVLAAIRARLDAVARNDVSAWASYVADDMLAPLEGAVGSKQAWLQAHGAAWPSTTTYSYGPLEDVKIRVHGDTAVVAFRARQTVVIDGQSTYTDSWQVETHIRRAGHWQLLLDADSPIAPGPTPIATDAERYDALVGEYQWSPGFTSVVRREGDHLYEHYTNETEVELLPESESTFFIRGEAAGGGTSRFRFVRNAAGVVTHYAYWTYGSTEFIARRIR